MIDYLLIELDKPTSWIYWIILTAVIFVMWRTLKLFTLLKDAGVETASLFSEKTKPFASAAIEACPIAGLAGTFAAVTSALTSNLSNKSNGEFIEHVTSVLGVALPTSLAGMLISLLCMLLVASSEYLLEKHLTNTDHVT